MDNLNTHAGASLDKAFEPAKARRLLEKLLFMNTPGYDNWLNVAEFEFSVLARKCLNPRLRDIDTVELGATAWTTRRNARGTPPIGDSQLSMRASNCTARTRNNQIDELLACRQIRGNFGKLPPNFFQLILTTLGYHVACNGLGREQSGA